MQHSLRDLELSQSSMKARLCDPVFLPTLEPGSPSLITRVFDLPQAQSACSLLFLQQAWR
jgi:hypothetical protein